MLRIASDNMIQDHHRELGTHVNVPFPVEPLLTPGRSKKCIAEKCGIAAAAAVSAAMVWLGATGSQEAKAQAPGAAAKLALVKDGNALATIVIPAQASQTEAKAAGELQQFLLRLSGAKLPIQKDAADVQGTAVSVGLTKLVPEEVRKELAVGEKLAVTDSRRDSFLTRAEAIRCSSSDTGTRRRSTAFTIFWRGWAAAGSSAAKRERLFRTRRRSRWARSMTTRSPTSPPAFSSSGDRL